MQDPRPRTIAIALCAGILAPAIARAEQPCGPAVRIEADPGLRQSITSALERRGVGWPPTGCPSVVARVAPIGGDLVVDLEDPDGRIDRRRTDRLETVVDVIESWARPDLVSPLLRRPVDGPRETAAPELTATVDRPRAIPVAPTPLRLRRSEPVRPGIGVVSIGAEVGVTDLGTLATGLRLSGCVRVGSLCVGTTTRLAEESHDGQLSDATELSRSSVEVLATVSAPVRLGGLWLSPGVAVGYAALWHRVEWLDEIATLDSYGARAEVQLALGIPLARLVAIDVGLSLGTSFLASTSSAAAEELLLRGEPVRTARLSLGLSAGAP